MPKSQTIKDEVVVGTQSTVEETDLIHGDLVDRAVQKQHLVLVVGNSLAQTSVHILLPSAGKGTARLHKQGSAPDTY